MGLIYKITSPNNKLYVGKTYDLRKRINAHKCATKYGKNIILHNSIRKYGWDAHVLEILEECSDELMNDREMFWIAELKTYCYENKDGMNMTKGGDGQRSTWMHDLERRKKQSERFSGSGGTFYGKKHTKETKRLIGEKASKRNKETNCTIPEWGVEKGRQKARKAVMVYDNNGDFVSEFISISEAARKLELKLASAKDSVLYNSWIGGKYLIKYKTENYPLKIEVGEIKIQTAKRPVYWLSEDLEPICEFPSAKEASDFFGIPKTTINRASMYNDLNPIRTGHIFLYKDLYLKEYKLVS